MRVQPHHAPAMVAALARTFALQGLPNLAAAGPVVGAAVLTESQEKRIVSQAVSILLMSKRSTAQIEIANRALLTDPMDVNYDSNTTPKEYQHFLNALSDILRSAVKYERSTNPPAEREPVLGPNPAAEIARPPAAGRPAAFTAAQQRLETERKDEIFLWQIYRYEEISRDLSFMMNYLIEQKKDLDDEAKDVESVIHEMSDSSTIWEDSFSQITRDDRRQRGHAKEARECRVEQREGRAATPGGLPIVGAVHARSQVQSASGDRGVLRKQERPFAGASLSSISTPRDTQSALRYVSTVLAGTQRLMWGTYETHPRQNCCRCTSLLATSW